MIILSTKIGERDLVRFVQVLLNMENCIKRLLYIRTRFEKRKSRKNSHIFLTVFSTTIRKELGIPSLPLDSIKDGEALVTPLPACYSPHQLLLKAQGRVVIGSVRPRASIQR